MNKSIRILGVASVLVVMCIAAVNAQRMPQDNWYLEKTFGQSGSGDGQFNGVWGIAVGSNDNVFVVDQGNHRIQVFNQNGTFLFKWGSNGSGNLQFSSPRAIAIGTNGLVYVADLGNNRIQVFNQAGSYVRGWPCPSPSGIGINRDSGLIHVADNANKQIKVFLDNGTTGTLVRAWGEAGSMPGKFEDMRGVAVGIEGLVYVADARSIQMFDVQGSFKKEILPFKWPSGSDFFCVTASRDGLVIASEDTFSPRNFSALYPFTYVFDKDLTLQREVNLSVNAAGVTSGGNLCLALFGNTMKTFRRTFRTVQETALPLPNIQLVSQRPGTTYVDIDYEVTDYDSHSISVGVLAFSGGTNSLNNLLRLNTFAEETATNVGDNVAANVSHRLTWNAAADWSANYGEAKFRILASDGRGLLDHVFINMPADGTNAALTIARDPVTQYDMLHCWYWLIATNDPTINLTTGRVYGVGGNYNGVLLASNITTLAQGRSFLFERMGLREATAPELSRMRNAAVGVQNQWTPRIQVGPGDRPKAVNEWGFDTGNWGSDGWWVVKP